MRLSKFNQIVSSLMLFIVGIYFISFLTLSLITETTEKVNFSIYGFTSSAKTLISTDAGIFPLLFVFVFLFVFVDMAWYTLKKAVTIKNANIIAYSKKNIWWFWAFLGILKGFISGIICLIFFAFLAVTWVWFMGSLIILNPAKSVLLGLLHVAAIIAAYLTLRFFAFKLGRLINNGLKKTMPLFTFNETGLDLDLKVIGLAPEKRIVHFNFDELDEIRVMDFFETQAYMKELGLNFEEAWKQAKSFYNIGKERPKTYIAQQSNCPNILLRGTDIHYLLGVSNENCQELIKAFDNFNKQTM